jgi:GAF domain-containing protein
MLEHHLQLRVGQQGIIGHVAESRRAYITADVTSDPYYLTLVELPHTRSEATLPLIYQGELVGVLDVQSRKPAAFTEEAIRVLQVLADNLAVAIQNVSHAEEIERTLDRLTRYQEEEVLRLWQKTLRRHVGRLGYFYDRAQVSLLPADTPLLAAVPAGVDRPVTLTTPEGAQRLVVPLRVRERTVGRFVFEAERPWTPEELGVVEAVVAQLGLALENAQLLEESRQRAVFERTASEVTANIRREVEIEAVLERALAELGKALGAERAIARLSITE